MLNQSATDYAPWYVLPADNPWLSQQIATEAIIKVLEDLNPKFPQFSEEERAEAEEICEQLKNGEI